MAERKSLTPLPVEVAHRRRGKVLLRRDFGSLMVRLCVITAALWTIFTRVFLITQCAGQGMFPAIEDGDLVLAYRLQGEYSKGDVVIYTVDGASYLGRVVARETDVVTMDESGTLVINGATQSGQIMYPTYAGENTENPLCVSEGMLYILGDYRTQTKDSREFGPIPLDDIQGKVITIVRRRGV